MITRVLYAACFVLAVLCLLAFLSVISHGLAIPLLIAALIVGAIGYVLSRGHRAV